MGNTARESQALDALAQALAAKVRRADAPRPTLRSVPSAPRLYDDITRVCCLKRIRFLARSYRLDWLVEQATFNEAGLESLPDSGLSHLLADMERARECLADGVSFEDAGLVRDTSLKLPPL